MVYCANIVCKNQQATIGEMSENGDRAAAAAKTVAWRRSMRIIETKGMRRAREIDRDMLITWGGGSGVGYRRTY